MIHFSVSLGLSFPVKLEKLKRAWHTEGTRRGARWIERREGEKGREGRKERKKRRKRKEGRERGREGGPSCPAQQFLIIRS